MTGRYVELGRIGYAEAWRMQEALVERVRGGEQDTLLLLEHDPVLTLGAAFEERHLLSPPEELARLGIAVHRTDRGGDVTYHGPGQLVIYPVFDLTRHGKDLHAWIRRLEGTIMSVCAGLGLNSRRFPPHTGVWIDDRKVCALGIKVRRWVSYHGLALNCDNALDGFETIVPCGIADYGVTSLTEASGRPIGVNAVLPAVVDAFEANFDLSLERVDRASLGLN